MYLRPILLHAFLISNFQFDRSFISVHLPTFEDNRHLTLMNKKEGNASTLVYGEDPIESRFNSRQNLGRRSVHSINLRKFVSFEPKLVQRDRETNN